MVKLVLLEWLNKLGGILLFTILYFPIFSIVLFYGARTQLISKQAVGDSYFYSLIASPGPKIIRFITGFVRFGQDMFIALEGFFDKISGDLR
jgi:membrane protein required for colicin V production